MDPMYYLFGRYMVMPVDVYANECEVAMAGLLSWTRHETSLKSSAETWGMIYNTSMRRVILLPLCEFGKESEDAKVYYRTEIWLMGCLLSMSSLYLEMLTWIAPMWFDAFGM